MRAKAQDEVLCHDDAGFDDGEEDAMASPCKPPSDGNRPGLARIFLPVFAATAAEIN